MKEFVDVYPDIIVIKRDEMFGTTKWSEMFDWAVSQGIGLIFKNHWTEFNTHHYSFELRGSEEQRMWFTLRYS